MSTEFTIAHPLKVRWEHNQMRRYYQIHLQRDLLGDWILTRSWGNLTKQKYSISQTPFHSHRDALLQIERISKSRLQKGYQLI